MVQIIFRGLLTKKYRYIFDFQVKISTILMNANHKKTLVHAFFDLLLTS